MSLQFESELYNERKNNFCNKNFPNSLNFHTSLFYLCNNRLH